MKKLIFCIICKDERWMCETHPNKEFSHNNCNEGGYPCSKCNTGVYPKDPPGFIGYERLN